MIEAWKCAALVAGGKDSVIDGWTVLIGWLGQLYWLTRRRRIGHCRRLFTRDKLVICAGRDASCKLLKSTWATRLHQNLLEMGSIVSSPSENIPLKNDRLVRISCPDEKPSILVWFFNIHCEAHLLSLYPASFLLTATCCYTTPAPPFVSLSCNSQTASPCTPHITHLQTHCPWSLITDQREKKVCKFAAPAVSSPPAVSIIKKIVNNRSFVVALGKTKIDQE